MNKYIVENKMKRWQKSYTPAVSLASVAVVLPVVALVAVALAAAEQVEVGKTKSFTQVLSYVRIAPYSDLFEQGTLWKR